MTRANIWTQWTHDEDGSREPVDLEQVQQEADDASYPGHQGAGADCLVPDDCGEHLRRVDKHDGETGGRSELPEHGEDNLKHLQIGVGGPLQQAADYAGYPGKYLKMKHKMSFYQTLVVGSPSHLVDTGRSGWLGRSTLRTEDRSGRLVE